ncbi:GGDEF domain-containing protein [Variovorax sp. HJSM1_2]|uniref:GGDEF domain-containing protein n=1 Tax=Variovorax sp. HJSM1_2 TaxID=3366263 RepID=UPI003BBA63D3
MSSTTPAPVIQAPKASTLGVRLVLATLLFSLLFTVVVVAARTWSTWKSNVAAMDAELHTVAQIYQRTLAKSIWDMDHEALEAHLAGLSEVASVGRAVITFKAGTRKQDKLENTRAGWAPSSLAPSLQMPLIYEPFPGGNEKVGEFALLGDERVLWVRLRSELAAMIVTQVAQSLLLASLIMLLFHRLVTVHVRHIASHLAQLRPSALGRKLALNRRIRRPDELSALEAGVNQLQSNVADYLEQQQRFETELAEHRDRLALLVNERTAALQASNNRLENANIALENLVRTDALTGLANRRQFDETKEVELRRALRTGSPLTLLVCDIDNFKLYNDTYGHAVGDHCLCAVATTIGSHFGRAGDLVARMGGEEFVVLLPATEAAHGLRLANELLAAVAALGIENLNAQAAKYITLSIGLAELDPQRVDSVDVLFKQADAALYRAKSAGRNRVAVHGQEL